MRLNKDQEDFLGHVFISKETRNKKKKEARKRAARKESRENPKKQSDSKPKPKLVLDGSDADQHKIRPAISELLKKDKYFTVEKLQKKFNPSCHSIVNDWVEQNEVYVFMRLYNNSALWDNPRYIEWKNKLK